MFQCSIYYFQLWDISPVTVIRVKMVVDVWNPSKSRRYYIKSDSQWKMNNLIYLNTFRFVAVLIQF